MKIIIVCLLVIAAVTVEPFLNIDADLKDPWYTEIVPMIVAIAATVILVEFRSLVLGI